MPEEIKLSERAKYGENLIWVRPLEMFLENVVIDGNLKLRFKLIEENK